MFDPLRRLRLAWQILTSPWPEEARLELSTRDLALTVVPLVAIVVGVMLVVGRLLQ